MEVNNRPTGDDVYASSGLGVGAAHTSADICGGTGRQSADANTGTRAATATPVASRTCDDVLAIHPLMPHNVCNAGLLDIGLIALYLCLMNVNHP